LGDGGGMLEESERFRQAIMAMGAGIPARRRKQLYTANSRCRCSEGLQGQISGGMRH
jgi:hypothetical protein